MNLGLNNNDGIKNFFSGDNSYIPTSEMYYLSTRPLIKDTFLHEVRDMIPRLMTHLESQSDELKAQYADSLEDLVIAMDKEISQGWPTPESTTPYLLLVRELYNLCKRGFN